MPQTIRLDDPSILPDALRVYATHTPRSNRALVLVGADDQTRQIFVGTLAAAADMQLHQIDLSDLHAGDMPGTQGNLREAFDASGEVPSVLCFHTADGFFDQVRQTDREEQREHDELTEDVYLVDRIAAFGGLVVIAFDRTRVPTRIADEAAYVVQA